MREEIQAILARIAAPGGGTLASRNMIRDLTIKDGKVAIVIEAANADEGRRLAVAEDEARGMIGAIKGVESVQIVVTAHEAAPASPPPGNAPDIRIGGHASPHQGGPSKVSGIDRIIAIASGKGGVGKSTVSSNLAVALARQGRRVGLLDADIHGPSQARMMGVSKTPGSPDGKQIEPQMAHGVAMMSMGLLLKEDEPVIWRGPMLVGALQQLITQVMWGDLDVLIMDLPPGTGDIQLSLVQRTHLTGAIIVSTPQDVALLDARKALGMFVKLDAPVLGLIENMSTFICPNCHHESHIFGHGGVAAEAEKLGLPFLGELPLALDVREGGDSGIPIAATDSPNAAPYMALARRMIEGGMA